MIDADDSWALMKELAKVMDDFTLGKKQGENVALTAVLGLVMEKMYVISGGDFDLMRSRFTEMVTAMEKAMVAR